MPQIDRVSFSDSELYLTVHNRYLRYFGIPSSFPYRHEVSLYNLFNIKHISLLQNAFVSFRFYVMRKNTTGVLNEACRNRISRIFNRCSLIDQLHLKGHSSLDLAMKLVGNVFIRHAPIEFKQRVDKSHRLYLSR